ncbi:PEP/pyruvate-binding domain-containing protein [Paraliomyxa miuraensis]|uniref:PEP/pyruvate-binding domain-containing protein n=1 Tax=Paraliomyxa miuraensis TaxID=376150 RepID=UPI002258ED40|nr:PEP/pyruvate-binding domain-containing protein [Paraliomyxa miuraensis]MCX4242490.1 PEP/pyruvate-binding domain-containing protein [Paraliomyxa miuraensis]
MRCRPHEDLCAEASERMGHTVCVHAIDDDEQWTRLSVGGGAPLGGIERMGKYLVPLDGQARLPTVLSNANLYRLHYCLMSVGFAPQFPGLTPGGYARLILTHAGREFYAGALYELQTPDPARFGFSVEAAARPEEQLTPDEIYTVYRQLSDRFAPGELGYIPYGAAQQLAAAAWSDPPFPVLSPNAQDVPYEVYTPGIAYGRVRLQTAGPGSEDGSAAHGWQDIVVFEEVPIDLEGVRAAAVTGQRQDVLSHLNVLSAQRGTPNAHVHDAIEAFSPFEGQLVRLEAQQYNYTLTEATQEEAEAHWQMVRPHVEVDNPAQLDYVELDAFDEIPTATAQERSLARARFGAKTVGLAVLSRLLDPALRTPGLGVPFHYYDEFMTSNTWSVDVGDGPQSLSYAQTIEAWLGDEAFRTDATVRKDRLAALRSEMRTNGAVSPALVQALHDRIVTEFGSNTVMVRMRSSSNAEDTPSFNGAGLYDSTSACAADSMVEGDPGTSACDPDKDLRTLERGLVEVWSSLWNFGAFEERDYYQLDHTKIAMGATISLRYEGEHANGVAFTGDPIDPRSPRFTVNAQLGEVDVVSPTPGVTAELSLLTMQDGQVAEIERVVASTLVPAGQVVLDDDQLRQLGAVMAQLQATYPVDAEVEAMLPPILDLEFKITSDDALVIKQIRTFQPSLYAPDTTCLDSP